MLDSMPITDRRNDKLPNATVTDAMYSVGQILIPLSAKDREFILRTVMQAFDITREPAE